MNKNRAGLLALSVVVAATILMVFFVLPQVTGEKQPIGDAVNQASKAVNDAVQETAKETPVAVDAQALTQKMGRLTADALFAVAELKALFAGGEVPESLTLSQTKATTEIGIKSIAEFDVPAGLEASVADALTATRDGARKALPILQSLPTEPAGALAAIAEIEAALTGKPVEKPVAASDATALTGTQPAATDDKAAASDDKPVEETAASAGDKPAEKEKTLPVAENTTEKTNRVPGKTASDETIPAFDVLRVEPDGSTVIAGRAAPNTKLDVLNGDKVVSSVDVSSNGDFAAILDDPLPAGDHQLTLKATAKDGKSTVSEEVATVSVPKSKGGELLAMVTTPGKASRIIAAPDAGNGSGATATADTSAADGQTVAEAKPADTTPDEATTADRGAIATPDLPAGSSDLFASAPDIAGDGRTPPVTDDLALLDGKPEAPPQIRITAVEIEANKIFVAGIAKARSTVIGYADDVLIGRATTEPEGHFVVEGTIDLAVGDHTIRVDMVDASGKVLVRASVPFNRPEGNQVSAVADAATPAGTDATQTAALDPGFRRMHGDLVTAYSLLRNLFANARVPGAEELAAARSATEIALKSLSEFRPADDASEAFKEIAAKTAASASKALAALQSLPKEARAVAAQLDRIGTLITETLQYVPQADEPAVANTSSATGQADTGVQASAEPLTISQAPLTESKNSVIIRRGDTLWQISRRVYGLGVRYTTIYVANAEQITNPDRIRPGQIFGLPKDALPDAETLHRKRLHGDKIN